MLSKAKLFPTEAARGSAQIVLVRRLLVIVMAALLLCIIRAANLLTKPFFLIEYRLAVPAVLSYRSCVYSAEHQLAGSIDRGRSALWGGWRGDGLGHQAPFLGASPI
jgi:hypothetical protein